MKRVKTSILDSKSALKIKVIPQNVKTPDCTVTQGIYKEKRCLWVAMCVYDKCLKAYISGLYSGA